MRLPIAILALVPATFITFAHAASRTSASYSLTAEAFDFSGDRASSASYRMDTTAGAVDATASGASDRLQAGFAAQWVEYATLALRAEFDSVAETATRQIVAIITLDDGTHALLPGTSLQWMVEDGPGVQVSNEGLFFAGAVFADARATAGAFFGGLHGTIELTVVNVARDDFGAYAGDGLDDGWQLQHFGPDNPLARPDADPDNDGFSNAFECAAGLDPNSSASVFRLRVTPDSDHPSQMRIVFGPLSPEVDYTVESSAALGLEAAWRPLSDFVVDDANGDRAVTDVSPPDVMRFYRVALNRRVVQPRSD